MKEEDITIVDGPNSDFGKYLRKKEADKLFRESQGLTPDVPIDISSKDYRNFWANYSATQKFKEEGRKFYESQKPTILKGGGSIISESS